MGLVAWLVLGAIAGYVAGLLLEGSEGLGLAGHIALGVVGAFVGGVLATSLLGVEDPLSGPLDVGTLVIATVGAIVTVVAIDLFTNRERVRV
ncbi:MAG TPA: GlsB/YeaQ/YmgE family stress response membrane protein [Candidatus Limnocylindrales bacterium]